MKDYPCSEIQLNRAFTFTLKKMYGIRRNDIPSKTEEFAEALQHIFGLGSKVILIEIMKKLHEKQRLRSQRQINVSS